jgi:1-aminocyclopropane-1-carboxylate deaminase/D-cysteine desulfhydrase-like pyridoxal-dependent ACC family enzyme
MSIALFRKFPILEEKLPRAAFGTFPTPVKKLEQLGQRIGSDKLYIKLDNLSGNEYGGNKVRKLEFLFGQALHDQHKEVMTFGCAGSNHAAATAVYAHKLGLKSISMLLPQPNAHSVRKNLLLSFSSDAQLYHYENISDLPAGVSRQRKLHKQKTGQFPYEIPAGGSSPEGVCGFVNAAFELKEQIDSGEIPLPDRVYLPIGTMGTAVGLLLGFKALGMPTKVIGIRVTSEHFVNTPKALKLFRETNSLLHKLDPAFPELDISADDIIIRHEFFGVKYGLYTEQAMEAVKTIKETEGTLLEGTYTGKALAGLISDVKNGSLENNAALFWNTYNSVDFSNKINSIDYHKLPPEFHRYFEEEVQPLDRNAG